MRTRFSVFALLVLSAACGQSLTAALARDLPIQGGRGDNPDGSGGSAFRDECPGPQSRLVGFRVRSGLWLDQITPMCGEFNPVHRTVDSINPTKPHGGNGGVPLEAWCTSDRFVSSITFSIRYEEKIARYVDAIAFTCTSLARPRDSLEKHCLGNEISCGNLGKGFGALHTQQCRWDEAATGIRGREGSYVDALGLMCGPKPGSPTTTEATPPPDPQRPATPYRQVNTRFYGTALRGVNGAYVSDCMEQCSRDGGRCKGWTWYERSNKCYLWKEISKTEPNDCCVSGLSSSAPPAERPIKRMGKKKNGEDVKITKEECEAEGSLWVPQKERCMGKALVSALRTVCEKKGADFRFDPQTAQCIGPQDGGQQGGAQNVCEVQKPVDICPTTEGCGGDTGIAPIGVLEAVGTVTVLSVQGPWHEVKAPGGRQGFVYSGPGYQPLKCP